MIRLRALGFLLSLAASAAAQSPKGAILVRVADADDHPIWGAEVDIVSLDVHFSVPDGGMLLIKDVRPGAYVVQARRVGYAVQRRLVKVGDDTTRVQFTMPRINALLDTVTVSAVAGFWLEDFDRHRRMGLGQFYGAAEIAEARPPRLSTYLARARGVDVRIGEPDIVQSRRAIGRCPAMQIYLDGMIMNATESTPVGAIFNGAPRRGFGNATAFDINSIPTSSIAAIEVYTDVATIPPLFRSGRDECGAMLIWTK